MSAPRSNIANVVSDLQQMLAELSRESAESNAALLAGHEDCARLQENSTLLSKQFSRAAMKVHLH